MVTACGRTVRFVGLVVSVLLCSSVVLAQEKGGPPDADKDGERLGKRLIRKGVTDSGEDLMEALIRSMGEAARRLEIRFDAGNETQALQRRIVDRLDDAIKVAAARRRPIRRRLPPSGSDKRRMPKGRRRTGRKTQGASGDRENAAARSSTSEAAASGAKRKPVRGELRELRRTWGHLPMREREEIIQGLTESFIERYREWIERYYRALQEAEE